MEEARLGSSPSNAPSHLGPAGRGVGGKAGGVRRSPLAHGLAHAEAHALQDRQAHLLSLKGQGREAQGPLAISNWEFPGGAAPRG